MELTESYQAQFLIDSLEYIKKFHNKIVVIKYGGNAMLNEELKDKVIQDIALLKYTGMHPVLVHGGGPEISQFMQLKGIEPQFVEGLRVTTPETMKIAEMVLTGSISPEISSRLNAQDVLSVSVSGKDGKSIMAKQKDPELGLVGEVTGINSSYILSLIEQGYLPVVSPVAYGEGGVSLNINADEVAKHLAIALQAEKLILLTDVDGVLADPHEPDSLIPHLSIAEAKEVKVDGTVTGGMIPKLDCCIGAVQGGVADCHIINGTIAHSLLFELFTKSGVGTMISADEYVV